MMLCFFSTILSIDLIKDVGGLGMLIERESFGLFYRG